MVNGLRVLKYSWAKIRQRFIKSVYNTDFTSFAQTIDGMDAATTVNGLSALRRFFEVERSLPEEYTFRRASVIVSHLAIIFTQSAAKAPTSTHIEGACLLLAGLLNIYSFHANESADDIFKLAQDAGLNGNCTRWIEKVTLVTKQFHTVANVPMSTKLAAFIGPFTVHPVASQPISYTYPVDNHSIFQVIRHAATLSGAQDPEDLTADESIQIFKDRILRSHSGNYRNTSPDTIKGVDVRPHCECALLLALYAEPKAVGYIGASKLACELCYLYFQAFRSQTSLDFQTRGTHGQFMPRWVYPELPDVKLNSAIRQELCEQLLKKVYDGAWDVELSRRVSQSTVGSDNATGEPKRNLDPVDRQVTAWLRSLKGEP
ncbi:hypothetical protein BDW22DRAFT_1427213 [Trametopsis cervina]|nr:hypothetical protein BDW22DRAFT_1427213 [Trametopsis cervina]